MKRLIFSILLMMFMLPVMAQSARDFIRMGNKAYREKQYDKAETMYLKSIAKDPTFEGYYNLGNAYVMQMKDSTAFENYRKADSIGTSDPMRKARNFHNMGNIWYAQGMAASRQQGGNAVAAFQRAVDFYKSSLRCNPDDNETRYNLAMAQHQLKKNQDQQNQNGGGGDDDKNKDKQDQQQQKQDQQKQDEQNKDKQDQQQQQAQPEQKKDDMSDQVAEQLLNSAQQDEKGVQRKVNKNQNNKRRSLEKDW
ncbi:MAG: aerotolerance regulator BatC [Bacteroidaceae bacterium]|nr:aerotolerance regulator BatC [Bacteroidaceae bacterium]